jgi:aminoglycoside phosphotransferase (APT) family kinase protein
MDRIDGVTLDEAWCDLPQADRECVAKQIVDLLDQLRGLQSSRLQSLGEQPLYSAFLFRNGFGLPHGPFESDEQVWEDMVKALKNVPDKASRHLRQRMPPCAPYTFTHGDLSTSNIMVKDGNVVGIIDWEASGYFPVWWEFVATNIYQNEKDQEWKTLLQKCMAQDHTKAQEFWLDYSSLSKYPDVDDRGRRLLNKLEGEANID